MLLNICTPILTIQMITHFLEYECVSANNDNDFIRGLRKQNNTGFRPLSRKQGKENINKINKVDIIYR
jgi:hypothetical protein